MTDAQIIEQLLLAMHEVFKLPNIEFAAGQNLRDFFGFDSVQFVSLILLLEERFGVTFAEPDVDSINVVGDLFRLLRGKVPATAAA
jgi:acyl carrier protein